MRRVLTGLAAGLLLGGAGCRHCCGDRPRLFDDTSRRDPDCRDNCPPTGRGASAPKLGTPLRGSEVGLSGGPAAYPILPTYPSPVVPGAGPADLLPSPTPGNIPPTDVPLSPTTPAVPSGSLLPAPSPRPAGR